MVVATIIISHKRDLSITTVSVADTDIVMIFRFATPIFVWVVFARITFLRFYRMGQSDPSYFCYVNDVFIMSRSSQWERRQYDVEAEFLWMFSSFVSDFGVGHFDPPHFTLLKWSGSNWTRPHWRDNRWIHKSQNVTPLRCYAILLYGNENQKWSGSFWPRPELCV